MENAVREIASGQSIEVVVLAALWDNPMNRYVDYAAPRSSKSGEDLLREVLARMVGALRSERRHVVLVGDNPIWRIDPVRLALARSIPLRGLIFCSLWPECIDLFKGAAAFDYIVSPDPGSVQVVREMTTIDDVRYLDLFGRFCDFDRCMFQRGYQLLFLDKSHLSPLGEEFAIEGLNILPGR